MVEVVAEVRVDLVLAQRRYEQFVVLLVRVTDEEAQLFGAQVLDVLAVDLAVAHFGGTVGAVVPQHRALGQGLDREQALEIVADGAQLDAATHVVVRPGAELRGVARLRRRRVRRRRRRGARVRVAQLAGRAGRRARGVAHRRWGSAMDG